MAKLRDKKINKDDIAEYLSQYSDFSFEIQVLSKLNALGFECRHSGTYEDPISKKTREFDIRASKDIKLVDNSIFRICLSVECKNIRENFPLVIHCMPREPSECFLDIISTVNQTKNNSYIPPPFIKRAIRVRLAGENCIFKPKDPVGKSCDQVGRKFTQDGEIVGNDSDVFDKISQAINASHDMIVQSHYASKDSTVIRSVVIPILVVPNDRIWAVWYDKSGDIEAEPFQTENVSYYIDKSWLVGGGNEQAQRYHLSHMEIVEIKALENLLRKYESLNKSSS